MEKINSDPRALLPCGKYDVARAMALPQTQAPTALLLPAA
jgi:hypothetical protein